MIAAETGEKTPDHPDNQFSLGDFNLLKSAAIYGPNASGKSNLLEALKVFKILILHSASSERRGKEIQEIMPFVFSTGSFKTPTFMECRFLLQDEIYRYGFETDRESVKGEWLYKTTQKEELLFKRTGIKLKTESGFQEGEGLEARMRDNALLLTVAAQFNGPLATSILDEFEGKYLFHLDVDDETLFSKVTESTLKNSPEALRQVENLLKTADTQIHQITLRQIDEIALSQVAKKIFDAPLEQEKMIAEFKQKELFEFHHLIYNKEGQAIAILPGLLTDESKGTQKLFFMSSAIFMALERGGVLVIDELEASLHPMIMEKVIELFHSPETNPNNAQLIFSTHATEILDNRLFRRDQIWFAEKDEFGATEIFSLSDIKGVRKDMAYGKNYLLGRFGAIPKVKPFKTEVEPNEEG